MKNTCYLLILFLFYPILSLSAEWNSFVLNFDKKRYGHGSQTWQISSYNENWTFFANKKGMLQFDGNEWKTFQMNNKFDVRSVLASTSHKRVYVGGINEYGFYEADEIGNMSYHCMSDTIDDAFRFIGNVWGIQEIDHILYFVGDRKVVKYLNGEYTVIEVDKKIDCSSVIRGTLYIGTDEGVWVLIGNQFFPLQDGDLLKSKRIRGFVPYEDGMLIVTAYNGLYYFDGQKLDVYHTGVEDFLTQNEVFSVAINESMIALGTVHKGIVLLDIKDKRAKYINEYSGLYNNTVLSLYFDTEGNLWAGLDNGISYIYLNSHCTNLYAHPDSFGTGYAAEIQNGLLYLGTNRGLYYTTYPVQFVNGRADIKAIPNSSGQVWNICRVGEDLFCTHDRGLFKIEGTTMTRIGDITGALSCKPLLNRPNLMFIGTYFGLYLAKKEMGSWHIIGRFNELNDYCRFLEQENEQVLWYQNVDHLVRIEFDVDPMRTISRKSYYAKDGLPENSPINLSKINDEVCFVTNSGIYQYNPFSDRIEPYRKYDNKLIKSANNLNVLEYENNLISLTPFEVCISDNVSLSDEELSTIYPLNRSFIGLVPTFETLIPINDSLLIIPNENGFALLKHSVTSTGNNHNDKVFIKKVYAIDSLIYVANFLNKRNTFELTNTQNAIRFEFGVPYHNINEGIEYNCRLNKGEWSSSLVLPIKEYNQLYEGKHVFEVKATLPDGTISIDSFEFTILPPWYRTTTAYVIYLLLLLLSGWFIYYWDRSRMRRNKQRAISDKERELLKLEHDYELEKEEKERQIMLLEKEKLEHELQHKSQEITNLMINVVRKNDMLTEIKTEILKVISQLKSEGLNEGKQQLIIINNKIESNIQSDEVLKRIEAEFDLLHNNFMKRLGAKHGDLSNNERMMCAYLKMNLSTKEIAPLLNISTRGVETIRYRLRKKFNLEREDSLTDYLENRL
ncbi:MAG: transcriptional regulator [Phocaeicola sp.]